MHLRRFNVVPVRLVCESGLRLSDSGRRAGERDCALVTVLMSYFPFSPYLRLMKWAMPGPGMHIHYVLDGLRSDGNWRTKWRVILRSCPLWGVSFPLLELSSSK